jgi:hypothetical protein
MVFLDLDGFWTRRYPVIPVLKALFGTRFDDVVSVVKSGPEAVAVIQERSVGVAKWASRAVDRKLRS